MAAGYLSVSSEKASDDVVRHSETGAGMDSDPWLAYRQTGAPAAFAAVVQAHTPMVYAACLRVLGDTHLAEDATQATFLVLARKARQIYGARCLASWLYRTAVISALGIRRTRLRSRRREQEAASMSSGIVEAVSDAVTWEDVRPYLDEALARLPAAQRDAVALCYFEGQTLSAAAQVLQCSPATLYKRLARAVEVLRARLGRLGFHASGAALAGLLASESEAAAPAGLAAAIQAACLGPSAVSPLALKIAEETMKGLFWTKVKMGAAAGLAAAVMAGAAGWGLGPSPAADSPVFAAAQPPAAGAPKHAPDRDPNERTAQPTAALPRAEDYQSFILSIDSPPDRLFATPQWMLSGGFVKGVAQLENISIALNSDATFNIREGKLNLEGNVLKGQFKTYDAGYRVGTWTLEGAVNGGKAAGGYTLKVLAPKTGEEKGHSGKFAGTIVAGSELAKSNAITAGKDWPCWSGPYTNMTSVPSGQRLVDDLDQARLVWRSQQTFERSQGNFGHPYRDARTLTYWPHCSGGAAPIVGDGPSTGSGQAKVFAFQSLPDGKEYDAAGLKKLRDAIEAMGLKEPLPAMKLHVSKTCHDWYIAMDAATGQTLWIAEFADETGSYFESEATAPDHKNGPMGLTPCYAQGKLFGLGLSGYLRAMDARTGQLLWKRKIAGTKPFGRGNCNCVMFIGGIVMAGDHGGTLHACDPETGAELWKAPSDPVADPQRWTQGGKEYAIVAASRPRDYRCLDPKTGKELWKLSGNFHHDNFYGLCGDVMALLQSSDGKGASMTLAAYKLTPEKAEKIWEVPSTLPADTRFGTLVTEKHVMVFGRMGQNRVRLLDRTTGKEAAVADAAAHVNFGHSQVADERLFVQPDGVHGKGGIHLTMLGTAPETFKVMGTKSWSPPFPGTSSYAFKPQTHPIVDGRLYSRGADGIYCVDLRKRP
jgi:RNA polymerase sigma factor (sigma-70 family)